MLGWGERFKIAVGVARGLAYLHHECLEWVVHCDVKPENILLDSDFEPKIADLGLAKLLNRGGVGSRISRARGTRGYMAPEWATSLPITSKVDVFSYGMVLIELIRGVRVWNGAAADEEETEGAMELMRLVRTGKERMESGEESWIGEIVDGRLNGQFNCRQAEMMVEIAVSCLEEDRSRRPDIGHVLQMLVSADSFQIE
ncbi:receptor protein kinase ZmPK1 [Canna indica]|uniref:Receptor protein kinase ZmPK1 n=1 Tax=Canna indica TaxID=4628 RepID=A0AAQ3KGI8_9LILI|nr:receptor protein kinase ZmPK1 [Canna indica]